MKKILILLLFIILLFSSGCSKKSETTKSSESYETNTIKYTKIHIILDNTCWKLLDYEIDATNQIITAKVEREVIEYVGIQGSAIRDRYNIELVLTLSLSQCWLIVDKCPHCDVRVYNVGLN